MAKIKEIPIGSKFNKWITVSSPMRKTSSGRTNIYYQCQCECGNLRDVCGSDLRRGKHKQCKECADRAKIKDKDNPIRNWKWNYILKNAEVRGLKVFITKEDAYEIFKKQDGKCALTKTSLVLEAPSDKRSLSTASLDRIDSNQNYTLNNVQWVHKHINKIKMDFSEEEFFELCARVYNNNKHNIKPIDKPSWQSYFMGLAFVISTRSMDSRTHHGCVIVDNENKIVGTGYNSFIRDIDESLLANEGELKYKYMIHSEMNAIFNSRKIGNEKLIAYVTGKPCLNCLQAMYQFGIRTIYAFDRYGWKKDEEQELDWNFMVASLNIDYYKIESNNFIDKCVNILEWE